LKKPAFPRRRGRLDPEGHLADAYLQNVKPRRKVPVLRTEHGVLTENVAILAYIARSFPALTCCPRSPSKWRSNTARLA
jgi:glutathione S-transferase